MSINFKPPETLSSSTTVTSSSMSTPVMSTQDTASSGTYSGRAAANLNKDLILNFCQVGKNQAPTKLTTKEAMDLIVNKLKVPPKEIVKVDLRGMNGKIKVRLNPTCNVADYQTANAMMVKPGLRLEPMKRVDKEVWVTVQWVSLDDNIEEILKVLPNPTP